MRDPSKDGGGARTVLLLMALLAILTGALGYTGVFKAAFRDPHRDLKQEYYAIVDAAQLWFANPTSRGGGGKSFIGLDFQQLRLTDVPGAITWEGRHGKFYLDGLSATGFILRARAPDGKELTAGEISFDTRPVFK